MSGALPIASERGGFSIDAALLGDLLDLPPAEMAALIRASAIAGFCEAGVAEDGDRYRLTFFYKGRRAWLSVDGSGRVMRPPVVESGVRHIPPGPRR